MKRRNKFLIVLVNWKMLTITLSVLSGIIVTILCCFCCYCCYRCKRCRMRWVQRTFERRYATELANRLAMENRQQQRRMQRKAYVNSIREKYGRRKKVLHIRTQPPFYSVNLNVMKMIVLKTSQKKICSVESGTVQNLSCGRKTIPIQ